MATPVPTPTVPSSAQNRLWKKLLMPVIPTYSLNELIYYLIIKIVTGQSGK